MTTPRNIICAPEDWELKNAYAITIAPDDHRQLWRSNSLRRLEDFYNQQITLFEKYLIVGKYDLYMEISASGRLHWHGTVKLRKNTEILDFYLKVVHELCSIATLSVKPIDDHDPESEEAQELYTEHESLDPERKYLTWQSYCDKQIGLIPEKYRNVKFPNTNKTVKSKSTNIEKYGIQQFKQPKPKAANPAEDEAFRSKVRQILEESDEEDGEVDEEGDDNGSQDEADSGDSSDEEAVLTV